MALNISVLGRCLTPSEKVAVTMSIKRIRLNEAFGEVVFWGKIFGDQQDYIILKATELRRKVQKKFYFSYDGGVTMSELLPFDEFVKSKAHLYHGHFTGNPSVVLKEQKPPRPAGEGDDNVEEEEEEEANEEGRKLTELERLSYSVVSIDNDTAVVPKGTFIRNASNDLVKDYAFKGLSRYKALQLQNFEHLRQSQSPENILALKKEEVRATGSNLDSLEDDLPKGSWSLQTDDSGTEVSLRSLKWPGFELQMDTHNGWYAQAYFGTGQRNQDIMFTI